MGRRVVREVAEAVYASGDKAVAVVAVAEAAEKP